MGKVHVRVPRQRPRIHPPVNQFNVTLKKEEAVRAFMFLDRSKPDSKKAKAAKLKKAAEEQAKSLAPTATHTAKLIEYKIKDVTHMIEAKRVRLVIIAHDVDWIEIIVWLPAHGGAGIAYKWRRRVNHFWESARKQLKDENPV
jgi:large subunit ribosomal protein L7Ae